MANFYCEYCGQKSSSVSSLTSMSCSRHPNGPGKGKHKLYEGSEKSKYTCKYCGQSFSSISSMTSMASLLDPNERHNLGDLPLSLFLDRIGYLNFGDDLFKTKVEVEKGVENMRRIDILLTNGSNAIIVENKLNDAVDQPDQLKDYLRSITERKYENIIIVYLPLYEYKSAKEKVEAKVVNLFPHDLLEWLKKCDNPICQNYIDLLQYVNQSNRNFMEAKKILTDMSAEQIEKLIAVATIVNSEDWIRARFEPIEAAIKQRIGEVQCKYKNKNSYVQLWVADWKFWVEVWIKPTSYDLYAYEEAGDKTVHQLLVDCCGLQNTEGSYFWKNRLYPFPSKDTDSELINDIVELLERSGK